MSQTPGRKATSGCQRRPEPARRNRGAARFLAALLLVCGTGEAWSQTMKFKIEAQADDPYFNPTKVVCQQLGVAIKVNDYRVYKTQDSCFNSCSVSVDDSGQVCLTAHVWVGPLCEGTLVNCVVEGNYGSQLGRRSRRGAAAH